MKDMITRLPIGEKTMKEQLAAITKRVIEERESESTAGRQMANFFDKMAARAKDGYFSGLYEGVLNKIARKKITEQGVQLILCERNDVYKVYWGS